MPAIAEKLITAEEFMNMPDPEDGTEQELIRGRVISMPLPQGPHGYSCASASGLVFQHSRTNRLGWVVANDTGVVLERDPDTVRGPDVAFWSFERLPKVPKGYIEIAPDLAVEVRSPGNTQRQILDKIKEYFFGGTKRVWVLDPEDRTVAIYYSPFEAKLLHEPAELDGEDILPGFRCKVADLFPLE